jgi:putative transposase
MKKSRFTEEQMLAFLREADKTPVAEIAKKHKVGTQAIYTWRHRFRTLEPANVKRLRQLEMENAKLKRIVAEHDLEIDTMKEIARRKW